MLLLHEGPSYAVTGSRGTAGTRGPFFVKTSKGYRRGVFVKNSAKIFFAPHPYEKKP
jgi:hypothetical protein